MVFHWSLIRSKSLQFSRTLLCILTDLNNAVVCIVSTRTLISKSSSLQFSGDCSKSTHYNWYHCHFHVPLFFYQFSSKVKVLTFFSFSFNFTLWSTGTATSTIRQVFFFLLIITRSGYSGRDYVIRLYLKIPEEIVRLLFQDSWLQPKEVSGWLVRQTFYL